MSAPRSASERIETEVLVVGGGMAAVWASIAAAREGASVVLVDKGYVGTSGVTATAGPGHWFVPPDHEKRAAAIAQRQAVAFGLADPRWMARTMDETWRQLPTLEGHYEFGTNEAGVKLYGAVRGPEYMRALRRLAEGLGVRILDHSPALELLLHCDGSVAGARGLHRQRNAEWMAHAGAVILATGGCAFFSRLLGGRTNTGDGYLMAAEAGADLSGMEFSSQYVIAPAFSTMGRAMSYSFATYYGPDLRPLDLPREGMAFTRALARRLMDGPVYCDLGRMPQDIRARLPAISPNVMLPFVRRGIDPFVDKFPVTLLAEGTVRGIGGIRVYDDDCQTAILGLYAAGDAATRELVAGATSGGGALNSAWALSSGCWAGRAAARRARGTMSRRNLAVEAVGCAGIRPRRGPAPVDSMAVIAAARQEATAYETNLFRTGAKLTESLGRLDALWAELRDRATPADGGAVRVREAAAVLATARWSYTAARARRESRGMHLRDDAPTLSAAYEERQVVSGVDTIESSFDEPRRAVRVSA
jgi:succinate dehydrogenase/fumarate reductase flavoprotein subunit